MKKPSRTAVFASVALGSVLALCSCEFFSGLFDKKQQHYATGGSFEFDLAGAMAVGEADLSVSAGSKAGSRADAENHFTLVKILENGSVELAIEFPEGNEDRSLPTIRMLETRPGSRDLFVALDGFTYFTYTDNPDGT